jgi:ParB family chromosome partitioning protein
MNTTTEVEKAYELGEISLNEISLNPFQPRRIFSEADLEELAESIRSVGLIHPPLVRRKPDGTGFELISGERRFRAARIAGLETIPVMITDATNMASAQAALIENVQRVDLNAIEVAKGLRRLMETFGFSQDELSERVGKKRSTIANYLRLLTLPKKIQDSLNAGEITMGHAKAILSVEGFERQMQIHQQILDEGLSVRETEDLANNTSYPKAAPPQKQSLPEERNVYVAEIENKMRQRLGTKVTVQGNDKGKIVIEYYSLDDLDRLIDIMAEGENAE